MKSFSTRNVKVLLLHKSYTSHTRTTLVLNETDPILSASVAQALTDFVTLTSRAWLVPVSRLTSGGMPPALRIDARLDGSCAAHSPKAPTTLTRTWQEEQHEFVNLAFIINKKSYTLKMGLRKPLESHLKFSLKTFLSNGPTVFPIMSDFICLLIVLFSRK